MRQLASLLFLFLLGLSRLSAAEGAVPTLKPKASADPSLPTGESAATAFPLGSDLGEVKIPADTVADQPQAEAEPSCKPTPGVAAPTATFVPAGEDAEILRLKAESEIRFLRSGMTLFTIFPQAGVFDLFTGDRTLASAAILLNGENLLAHAEVEASRSKIRCARVVGGVRAALEFRLLDDGWLRCTGTLTNTERTAVEIRSFTPLSAPLSPLWHEGLQLFADGLTGGRDIVEGASGEGVGVLFLPGAREAWSFGWLAPQRWSNRVRVAEGRWLLEWELAKPLRLAPGESIELDPLVINGHLPLTEGLLAFGRLHKPHRDLRFANRLHCLSTEEVRDDAGVASATEAILQWGKNGEAVAGLVLQSGWSTAPGELRFAPGFKKEGAVAAANLQRHGGFLGVGVRPSGAEKTVTSTAVRELVKSGVRYLRTDLSVWRGADAPARLPDLRQAFGKEGCWLLQGLSPFKAAGIVDLYSVAGPDAVESGWADLIEGVIRPSAARFWMHGNLFLNDLGALNPTALTQVEFQSRCAFQLVSGAPVRFATVPQSLTPEQRDLLACTLQHAGGEAGVPLDLESTELPTQWVRRERGGLYLALFNWGEAAVRQSLGIQQVRELYKTERLIDLFSGREVVVSSGNAVIELAPHQAFCARLP